MKTELTSLKYHLIPPKLRDRETATVRAVIETPRGSRHKFALDTKLGAFVLKQTLASGLSWPYDYGFIPQTRGDDGDPLDILVLMDDGTFTGCVVTVRILGYIGLVEDGRENDRFVGCLLPSEERSLSTDGYESIEDIPQKLLDEIQQFLVEYEREKDHESKVTGCRGVREAVERIEAGRRAFERDGVD